MPESLAVRCVRTFQADAERVFRAWTDPALIIRWWSPDADTSVEVLAWDLVPGGWWRFAYTLPDKRVVRVSGRFTEITPPRRLAFTWTWEPPDQHAGIETLVTVVLTAQDGRTTIRVEHDRFPDAETRDRHNAGWVGTLARLAEVVR